MRTSARPPSPEENPAGAPRCCVYDTTGGTTSHRPSSPTHPHEVPPAGALPARSRAKAPGVAHAVLRFVLALALAAGLGSAVARATLDEIDLLALPPEARQTLQLIRQGGPFPYPHKDGSVFNNFEKRLPPKPRGHYREYTVPTPGVRTRGARRIVAGSPPATSGEYYYTSDHYRSFHRIRGLEEKRADERKGKGR